MATATELRYRVPNARYKQQRQSENWNDNSHIIYQVTVQQRSRRVNPALAVAMTSSSQHRLQDHSVVVGPASVVGWGVN